MTRLRRVAAIVEEARAIGAQLGLTPEWILATTLDTIAPGTSPGFLRFRARFGDDPGPAKQRPEPLGVETEAAIFATVAGNR